MNTASEFFMTILLFFFFEKSGYERKLVDQLWNSLNIKFALRGLYHMSHDIL